MNLDLKCAQRGFGNSIADKKRQDKINLTAQGEKVRRNKMRIENLSHEVVEHGLNMSPNFKNRRVLQGHTEEQHSETFRAEYNISPLVPVAVDLSSEVN